MNMTPIRNFPFPSAAEAGLLQPDAKPTHFAAAWTVRSLFYSGLGWAVAFLLLAFAMPGAFAQVDQGSITGTITDSTGATIAGATVTVTNADTSLTFSRATNSAGEYTFTPLKI